MANTDRATKELAEAVYKLAKAVEKLAKDQGDGQAQRLASSAKSSAWHLH